MADKSHHVYRDFPDAAASDLRVDQGHRYHSRGETLMSYEMIAFLMFASMMLLLLSGQRVFGAIGVVAAIAAITLWGTGGSDIPFTAAMKLMKWYPLLTLPMFIFMGYVLSESKIADDLYKMFLTLAQEENRTMSNFIETSVLRFIEQNQFVDDYEKGEIINNEDLNKSLKRAHKDVKAKKGRFIE